MNDYLQIRELYHHGIKGQKWGVRRFQNQDGSLTLAGAVRYNTHKSNQDSKTSNTSNINNTFSNNGKRGIERWQNKDGSLTPEAQKKFGKKNVNELSKEQLSEINQTVKLDNTLKKEAKNAYDPDKPNISDALHDTSKLLNTTANAIPKGKGKYVNDKDYSKMSDQELRSKINRLQLEEQYGRLSGDTKYVESGRERTREILQTAGAVVAIGASAAGLAYTIQRMISSSKKSGD